MRLWIRATAFANPKEKRPAVERNGMHDDRERNS